MAEVKDQDIIRDIVSEMIERRQKRLNRSGYNDNLKRRQFQKSQNSPASGNSLLSLHGNFNNKRKFSVQSSPSQTSCHKLVHTMVEIHPTPPSPSSEKQDTNSKDSQAPNDVLPEVQCLLPGSTKETVSSTNFNSVEESLPSCSSSIKNMTIRSLSPTSVSNVFSSEEKSFLSEISTPPRIDKDKVCVDKMHQIITELRARANKVRDGLETPHFPYNEEEDDSIHEKGSDKKYLRRPKFTNDSEENELKSAILHQQQRFGNAHFKGRNFGALDRNMFDDLNSSRYASKSTIVFDEWSHFMSFQRIRQKLEFVDPRGYVNIAWLSLLAMIFLYNAWVIPLRATFPFATTNRNCVFWFLLDYLGDFICWMDIFIYKPRLMFIENGFWVKNKRRLMKHYIQEGTFKHDLAALIPTDILYLWFGPEATYLRLPRILKVFAYWEFIERLDAILEKPYILRIVKTVNYMLYLIHINACAYYAISSMEGIGKNTFVYDGEGNSYIRCFYFATKTATSIGKNKKPTNIEEILFMTASWLMGVFVFAILIGDIRDIVSNARVNVLTYQKQIDAITAYMNNNKVPRKVQDRVKRWMSYTWSTQKSFNERKMMEFLPLKMRTDIAMRVHFSTLGKVKLFRNCEPGLLKDLVVLLRPVIYLPGDFVCRKGDIGKEMFILESGQVQVLGGVDGQKVVVTLGQGSVFGEIALLGVGGMNRRTADVVSRGFTNLFVLQKDDLEVVLEDYPDAKRILNARARKLMKENEDRNAREINDDNKIKRKSNSRRNFEESLQTSIKPSQSQMKAKGDPALFSAVMKMLPPSSKVYGYFKHYQTPKRKKSPVRKDTSDPFEPPSELSGAKSTEEKVQFSFCSPSSSKLPLKTDKKDAKMKCFEDFKFLSQSQFSSSALHLLHHRCPSTDGHSSSSNRRKSVLTHRKDIVEINMGDRDETTLL